jgi:hypothetical protein
MLVTWRNDSYPNQRILMKIRKHVQYTCTQHFPHHIQYTSHSDTKCHPVRQTHRKPTQNTESMLGLATASNLNRGCGLRPLMTKITCNQQK